MSKIKQTKVAKKIKQDARNIQKKISHEDFAEKIGASKMSIEAANRFIRRLRIGVIVPRYEGDTTK